MKNRLWVPLDWYVIATSSTAGGFGSGVMLKNGTVWLRESPSQFRISESETEDVVVGSAVSLAASSVAR